MLLSNLCQVHSGCVQVCSYMFTARRELRIALTMTCVDASVDVDEREGSSVGGYPLSSDDPVVSRPRTRW